MKANLLALLLLSASIAATSFAEDEDMVTDRIDFSSARIMGQSNDFGAVYLSHRKTNELDSLLSIRSNYRLEVLFELDYLPVDESGEPIMPASYGQQGYEPGFEPVQQGK
ncbi:hypothetical protein [Reinekea marinisedimentorum]|uniref:Uncharacterized protein n=1 Tax=Reinekea marinisedimentorum TaxID=230495 RepID=A0A4R3I353_9GAMM|nr:hypothetical protein [Reinekea marinisedimentorum]TCS40218.1 hypothetical protein BCF53_110140 [Reinekea marinisedimentorum]